MGNTIVNTLVGAGIAIIPAMLTCWWTIRSQQKQQSRSLIFQAGIENWKAALEVAKTQNGIVLPLDIYILHMFQLWNVLERNDTTTANIAERLRAVNAIVVAASSEADRISKQNRGKA